MGWWDDRLQEIVAAIARGMSGAKLGPGVLRTVIPIVSIGFISLVGIAWALSNNPILAFCAIALVIGHICYVVERSFRYAENNPLPALLGGAELLQLFRDQAAARDKSIVVDARPEVGASVGTLDHEGANDV